MGHGHAGALTGSAIQVTEALTGSAVQVIEATQTANGTAIRAKAKAVRAVTQA